MKRILACLLLLSLLSLPACGAPSDKPGITGDVTVEQMDSVFFSQSEIDAAIREAEEYFRKEFNGCTLLTIRYAGDGQIDEMRDWAAQYGAERVIILISDFYVAKNGGDGSLNTDYTYTGWNWILSQDSSGRWIHRDHGY